jgi:hypothetical protein
MHASVALKLPPYPLQKALKDRYLPQSDLPLPYLKAATDSLIGTSGDSRVCVEQQPYPLNLDVV